MARSLVLLFFLYVVVGSIFSQKVIKTMSSEICTCIKDTAVKPLADSILIRTCMHPSVQKHMGDIKKQMDIDLTDKHNQGIDTILSALLGELMVSCPVFMQLMLKDKLENEPYYYKDSLPDSPYHKVDQVKAASLKQGRYRVKKTYMNRNLKIPDDTTYLEFTDGASKYRVFKSSGESYTYSATWTSSTRAELRLITQENIHKTVSRVGDKVIFKIINTKREYMVEEYHVDFKLSRVFELVKE